MYYALAMGRYIALHLVTSPEHPAYTARLQCERRLMHSTTAAPSTEQERHDERHTDEDEPWNADAGYPGPRGKRRPGGLESRWLRPSPERTGLPAEPGVWRADQSPSGTPGRSHPGWHA